MSDNGVCVCVLIFQKRSRSKRMNPFILLLNYNSLVSQRIAMTNQSLSKCSRFVFCSKKFQPIIRSESIETTRYLNWWNEIDSVAD
jgi:hypothetical protein